MFTTYDLNTRGDMWIGQGVEAEKVKVCMGTHCCELVDDKVWLRKRNMEVVKGTISIFCQPLFVDCLVELLC